MPTLFITIPRMNPENPKYAVVTVYIESEFREVGTDEQYRVDRVEILTSNGNCLVLDKVAYDLNNLKFMRRDLGYWVPSSKNGDRIFNRRNNESLGDHELGGEVCMEVLSKITDEDFYRAAIAELKFKIETKELEINNAEFQLGIKRELLGKYQEALKIAEFQENSKLLLPPIDELQK